MRNLLQRLAEAWRQSGRSRDEDVVANAALEHELDEREQDKPTALPPGRTNTDWTYVPPP